jgi:sugar phosphate isomerase/epimerase
MKLLRCLPALALVSLAQAASAADFHDHIGLQLWSLRDQTKVSTTGALDIAAGFGFTEVETAGTGSLSFADLAKELQARRLTVVAVHINYELLQKDLAAAIADVKTLGAKYLICPALPHAKPFTADDAHRVAAEFNAWGQACAAAGLKFGYHTHGFEFVPAVPGGETPFDVLMRETKPELVCFEMDVFWVFHAGVDPVKLLQKYPGRWRFLHLKDIRKGAVTGFSTGSASPTDRVAVGEGQINWPAVLGAAEKAGVTHYFIEDEGVQPLKDIPASLKYLKALKL